MNDLIETVVKMALVALPDDHVPTEAKIEETIDRLAGAFGLDAAGRLSALHAVQARRLVKMNVGFALAEQHVPWVDARRPHIVPFFWDRYKLHLQKEWSPPVLTAFDRSTDQILDLLGNPEETKTWKRRGLIMGDVQSGKTATYSALICKAADAGYRFIVLLSGTIENLRRQTQERLDEGFVGFDSSEHLKRNGRSLRVGVGLLDGRRQATVFTSSSTDFRVATLEALGLSLSALREPALVVIKKNTKILQNLCAWVKNYNTEGHDQGIDIPMLLIDDEADNASINTNDPDKDPTRVNAGIRELLKLFRRTTYVGVTATPFANIFVNPDSTEDMLGDDLFPRDFIYTLQSPTNYWGPGRIFLDDAGEEQFLRKIEDVEVAVPSKHKADFAVRLLPPSLVNEALAAFLVANAIRDLRGDQKKHRSMLVNVSQFTKVQDQVEELLHAELEYFKTAVRNFSALEPEKALADAKIKVLFDAWKREYEGCGHSWAEVQRALHNAILPITTKAVNSRTGPKALDYRPHKETGLRVIAVGGNSLSRGLTLEGLMTSYFRRTTRMYDTLLQMGRWFGYRPNYEDLCRVWLPRNTVEWYGHISEATDELRAELKRMFRDKKTPEDFGLTVRAHPESLLVTARNKMRTAKEITRVISLSAHSFESVELPGNPTEIASNWGQASQFVRALAARLGKPKPGSSPVLFQGATRSEVARLLSGFQSAASDLRFQSEGIVQLLEQLSGDALNNWDVAIPTGDGDSIEIGGVTIARQKRIIRVEEPPVLVISGSKRRVGSRGVEKAGLTEEQIAAAKTAALKDAEEVALKEGKEPPKRVNVSDRFYREQRARPLLLIHVIQGSAEVPGNPLPALPEGTNLIAIGLSFPTLDGEPAAKQVKYKINLVKVRELFGAALDQGDDEEFQEEEQ